MKNERMMSAPMNSYDGDRQNDTQNDAFLVLIGVIREAPYLKNVNVFGNPNETVEWTNAWKCQKVMMSNPYEKIFRVFDESPGVSRWAFTGNVFGRNGVFSTVINTRSASFDEILSFVSLPFLFCILSLWKH